MTLPRRLALVSILAAAAAACSAGGVTREDPEVDEGPLPTDPDSVTRLSITSPVSGTLLSTNTVEVVGTTTAPAVRVGGVMVEAAGGRFTTTVDLVEGENTILATAGDAEAAVSVIVDSEGPTVEILSPEPGSYVVGGVLEVTGRAIDANLDSVTVDGEAVDVASDGTFTWTREVAPGAYRVRAVALDRAGQEGTAFTTALVGRFAGGGELLSEAVALHVGPRALGAIADGVEPMLSSSNLRPLLMARNPVVSGGWGRLEALGESHTSSTVTITPRDGTLEIRARLTDIEIPLKAFINWFPDITGTASASAATATIIARVGASGGRPVVTIASTTVVIEGLLIDIHGLWDWIDRNVVTAAVRGKLESAVNDLAAAQVPPAVEGAIERIPLGHELLVMDEPVAVNGSVESLRVTPDGLDGTFGMGVEALDPDPALGWTPGSILLDVGGAPSAPHDDVRAALSVDLINAALHAGWSTGRLELFQRHPALDGETVTVGFLALLAPSVRDLAPVDSPISLYVRPALPPVVMPRADGELVVHANDIRVVVVAETDGGEVELFEVSLGVTAPVRISSRADEVGVSLGELSFSVDQIRGAPLPPSEELDAALGSLAGERAADAFVSISGFELPQLYGFSVTDYGADFTDEGYVVFEGRLSRD